MKKIEIINRGLISNKEIIKATTLPLWLAIVSVLVGIMLTALPIIIRSNETIERLFQNQPELIYAVQGAFDEDTSCNVESLKLESCEKQEKNVGDIGVAFNQLSQGSTSVSFMKELFIVQLEVNETEYRFQSPYSFDFSFNKLEEKEIVSYQLINELIQSTQFTNVINGIVAIGFQCLLYIGVGMLSLYSTARFQFKKIYSFSELFKIQSILSLSGGLIAFIICFIIDPFVAYAPTVFLLNIIVRTFDISTKMKKFTFSEKNFKKN